MFARLLLSYAPNLGLIVFKLLKKFREIIYLVFVDFWKATFGLAKNLLIAFD